MLPCWNSRQCQETRLSRLLELSPQANVKPKEARLDHPALVTEMLHSRGHYKEQLAMGSLSKHTFQSTQSLHAVPAQLRIILAQQTSNRRVK